MIVPSTSILFDSADAPIESHLGRLDYASLSQQALMEMFIDGITNKAIICGSAEYPKDLCDWNGLTFNESHEVTLIGRAYRPKLQGSLYLQWLPASVVNVFLDYNYLGGEIDLRSLPASLSILRLQGNRFRGSISLTKLPSTMKDLDLSHNSLTGSLDLENLPKSMEHLTLSSNAFSGSISLTRLPKKLKCIFLGTNTLSGTLDLTHLPPNLETLDLKSNPFSGSIDFSKLPDSLHALFLVNTKLEGTLVRRDSCCHFQARNSQVKIIPK